MSSEIDLGKTYTTLEPTDRSKGNKYEPAARLNIGIKPHGSYIFRPVSAPLSNPIHGCLAPCFLTEKFPLSYRAALLLLF